MSVLRSIDSHLDAEMLWIVKETASSLFDKNGGTVKRGNLCKAIGRVVGEVLINRVGDQVDRLGATRRLTVEEFERAGLDSLMGISDEGPRKDADAVILHVAEACILYAHVRLMGVKSAYNTERTYGDDYWPFGQEGGFCNPMKLKMMD